MVKYRLKKLYPGSPRLGSIIQDTNPNNGAKDSWFEENWGKAGKYSFKLSIDLHPENHPEFWEEVKEKEYEILAASFWFNGNSEIAKIKRLSDGEIFTTGDAVQLQMSNGKWWKETNCILSMIVIEDNKVVFYIDQGDIKYNKYSSDLSDWRKAKTPLFVTEDGVEIFEGDKCYIVGNNWNWIEQTAFTNEYGNNKTTYKQVWATKEAAEKWIDENKPKYSKKDILRLIEEAYEDSVRGLNVYIGGRKTYQIDFEGYYLSKLRDKILEQ